MEVSQWLARLFQSGITPIFLLMALSPVVFALVVTLIQYKHNKTLSVREHTQALDYALSKIRPRSRRITLLRRYMNSLFLLDVVLFLTSHSFETSQPWSDILPHAVIWGFAFAGSYAVNKMIRAHQDQLMDEKCQWVRAKLNECLAWCSDYLLIEFFNHQVALNDRVTHVFVFPEAKSGSVACPWISDYFCDPLHLNLLVVTEADCVFSLSLAHLVGIQTRNTLRNLHLFELKTTDEGSATMPPPILPADIVARYNQALCEFRYEVVQFPSEERSTTEQIQRKQLDNQGLAFLGLVQGDIAGPLQTDEFFLKGVVKMVYGSNFLELCWTNEDKHRLWIPKYANAGPDCAVHYIQNRIRELKRLDAISEKAELKAQAHAKEHSHSNADAVLSDSSQAKE